AQTITWTFTDSCGHTITHVQNITIEEAPEPFFVNPPGDTTLTCGEASTFVIQDLSYTNGESGVCEISGTVPGVLNGTFNICGGAQTITWTFTDSCGHTITHVQNITIEEAPAASFINPPGDTTLTCVEASTFVIQDLSYTNGESGTCEISGTVPGVLNGTFNSCGGMQTITWMFTDSCGRTISHVQN